MELKEYLIVSFVVLAVSLMGAASLYPFVVKPIVQVVDVLSKHAFDVTDPSSGKIDIPCGLFRFIDIELQEPLGEQP